MSAEVVKLSGQAGKKKPRRVRTMPLRSSRGRAVLKWQKHAATGVALVSLVITGLSLSHLAHGVAQITGISDWQSWATAIAIDVLMIALELALIVAQGAALKEARMLAHPTIIVVIATSAAMNGLVFSESATTVWRTYAAWGLGSALPLLNYVGIRIAVALWLASEQRTA